MRITDDTISFDRKKALFDAYSLLQSGKKKIIQDALAKGKGDIFVVLNELIAKYELNFEGK